MRAFAHPGGGLLLHARAGSRTARWHRRVGLWVVGCGDRLLGRFCYYGRPVDRAPLTWANDLLRHHLGLNGAGGGPADHATWNADSDTPPTSSSLATAAARLLDDSYTTPLSAGELPPVLVGAAGPWARLRDANLGTEGEDLPVASVPVGRVPAALAAVPPHRTVRGRLAARVLCHSEFELYTATWAEWVADHPQYAEPARRDDLRALCMERVLQHRILSLTASPSRRTAAMERAYHASFARMQRARAQLAVSDWRTPEPGELASGSYTSWFAGLPA